MKIFLIICLASGLASSEKLDRSYLPPPGSKFSGGSPGDIETPLEFPKQSGPQLGNGKPEIELGIKKQPPTGTLDQKPGFNFFQKSYPVPTTTTSYAITQTTTFAPDDEFAGIVEPGNFLNGSRVQSGFPGQEQGPYKQYRPGQSQSTVAPDGTKLRPQFPGVFNGPEYLPPVSNDYSPAQVINQDGSRYPSGLPQGPKYQDGQAISVNQPGYVSEQNQYIGKPNIPSTASPQYQGSVSQQSQNQFPGSQFPSTAVPQYQHGQRLITPGSNQQNLFTGSQFPSSTLATQYQDGQRLITPGSNQQSQFTGSQFSSSTSPPQYQDGQRLITSGSNPQNQFSGNQDLSSSTAAPQFQFGQRFTTPGLKEQVFEARVPNQQNIFTENQHQGNQNFPSTTAAPTLGSIEQNQFLGNKNFLSTAAPNYQDGQLFTTPSQIQPGFGSIQFTGQNFPASTSSTQFQDGVRLTTPGYVDEGYGSPVSTQQKLNQYPASQYQNGQKFITSGPITNQNFQSTAAPSYQGGQRFTTPGQYQGQYVPEQQRFGSREPGQIYESQYTAAPQYQGIQRFSTPGTQEKIYSRQPNQQNQYPGRQNFPTSTIAPQHQDGQHILTQGSGQTFGSPQLNQYSAQAPQYQGPPITSPGQLFNQTIYPGSTAAPQYQQTLAPTPGINQQGVIPSRQDQFQRPVFSQQFPSSTALPQDFIPGSQSQYGDTNILTPGGQIYGNNQEATSQTGASFASTTVRPIPARNFASTPGFGNIGSRPERPQAEGDRNAEILSYETVLTPEGYFYSYDTSNGIHADETGTVGNGSRAQGGFSYTGDDGKVYSVVYSADENGFRPRGDHLPTPPPIPEAIQRVIDQANKDKESGIDDDGSYNEEKYGYMKYEGPVNRLILQKKTTSVVNGADIPGKAENRIGGQTKKTSKTKGNRPVSDSGNNEEFESGYESETDETNMNGNNQRGDDNQNNNKDKNIRITSKHPKPIKHLTVEDKLKGTKMPLKPTNGSDRRPITFEEDEENTSDDITEESEDSGDLRESEDFDFDSDLVNYKDDPNNRTDFHGLNKYLPESKKMNRKNQSGKKRPPVRVKGIKQSLVKEAETPEDSGFDLVDKSRTRIPSRNNKISQKVKDRANVAGQTVRDGDDETNSYGDDKSDTHEKYGSDDETKPVYNDRVRKPGTPQLKKKISGKPKRPNVNERTDMSGDKETNPSSYEDKGYEYTPPQRQFGSEEILKFPSRINQKGSQTTLRPFMTKNVYGDDTEADEYNSEYDAEMPGRGRPITGQYPGRNKESDSYNQNKPEVDEEDGFSITKKPVSYVTSRPVGRPQTTGKTYIQNKPQVNEDEQFSTTRRPISYGTSQPSERPRTTGTPQYQKQGVNDQLYNPTIKQRPGEKLFYNANAPTQGTVSNVFSSTTPLPPSGLGYKYPRPGQNRPDGSYAPDERETAATSGQLPSTTYKPNYSFGLGDKISSPVTVDGFGRPIQNTNAPAFDGTLRSTYSTNKPSDTNQFRPTEGRFGVTSTEGPAENQSSSASIGEDFSGPKQPQSFDPLTGYHYK